MKANSVFLIHKKGYPLGLIHPAVCRQLFKEGMIKVISNHPFIVQLKKSSYRVNSITEVNIGIDPGVKHTGLSIFKEKKVKERIPNTNSYMLVKTIRTVLWSAILHHKTNISKKLAERRACRHARTSRNKRTGWSLRSKPREQEKPKRWLAPSVRARIENIANFLKRIFKAVPKYEGQEIYIEDVKFTPEAVEDHFKKHPEITSYKRAYVFHRDNYTCQYCGYKFLDKDGKFKKNGRQAELDHIVSRYNGGDNSRENLIACCHDCNQSKDKGWLEDWDCGPKRLPYVQKVLDRGSKPGIFKYSTLATIVRHELPKFIQDSVLTGDCDYLKFIQKDKLTLGYPFISSHPGWNTQVIRKENELPKDHHFDAACVGEGSIEVIMNTHEVFDIVCAGRGTRKLIRTDSSGFPKLRIDTKHMFKTRTQQGCRYVKKSVLDEKGEPLKDKEGNIIKKKVKVLVNEKSLKAKPMMVFNDNLQRMTPVTYANKKRSSRINGYKTGDLIKYGSKIDYITTVTRNGGIRVQGSSLNISKKVPVKILRMADGYRISSRYTPLP